jgi:tRNA-binding EMAP/Myf-like protein
MGCPTLNLTPLEAKRILIIKLQKQGMQNADIFSQFEHLNFNNLNVDSIKVGTCVEKICGLSRYYAEQHILQHVSKCHRTC